MILASVILPYLYFTLQHASSKRATIGKSAMGLIIVTVQGEQLSKLQALIRVVLTAVIPAVGIIILGLALAGMITRQSQELMSPLIIAMLVGVVAIYIGPFITVFFNKQHQTLFDMLCKTCVIKKPNP
jgi:uncharacterized RDD family membrane protein YckC